MYVKVTKWQQRLWERSCFGAMATIRLRVLIFPASIAIRLTYSPEKKSLPFNFNPQTLEGHFLPRLIGERTFLFDINNNLLYV